MQPLWLIAAWVDPHATRMVDCFQGGSTCNKGGLDLKPTKLEHIFVAVITFFPFSSVQILLIPACCLLCVL